MSLIRLLVATVLLGLAGCAHQVATLAEPWITIEGAEKIVAIQKEVEAPSLSLDKVTIVRMTMDGERIEVTSPFPTVIIAQPHQGNRTAFNLGSRTSLVLFTRDGQRIKGYRMEIPLVDMVPGKTFRFPVARDPGEVVERTFVVDKVITQ